MKNNYITPISIFKGTIHLIVVLIILYIMNVGLSYFLDFLLFKIFIRFNESSFYIKILALVIGGGIGYALLTFIQRTATILGGFIFNKINGTEFSQLLATIITIANAIYNIVRISKIPENYNFWIICELIIISSFIWSLNYIVLPAKEQFELYRKKDETY